jgi:gas vesicle protein
MYRRKRSDGKKIAIGAAIAAVAGFLAGILTAPKSGKETRQDIKDTAKKGVAEAEKELAKAQNELDKLVGTVKKQTGKLSGKANSEVAELVKDAKVAKLKAAEVLSAVRKGTAEDKELQRAVTDATKAVTHLKKYLKK